MTRFAARVPRRGTVRPTQLPAVLMARLKDLIHEIHRRSLWQVVGVYLAASWVVLQVVEVLTETAGLPDWVSPASLVLLLLGLPIVLATAIVQEGVGRRDEAGGEGALEAGGSPPGTARASAGNTSRAEAGGQPASSDPAPGTPASSPAGGRRTHHRLLTWRNALAGGGLAFVGLGAITAMWLGARGLGIGPAGTLVAKGVLEERAPLLVADFGSPSGDDELARAATEAFRIDLGQSEVIRVVEPAQVAGALGRMGHTAEAPLDLRLAREVALREGIPAIVVGEIGAVGGGYQLSARILGTSDQTVLVSHRVTAAGPEEVIAAIDQLSKRLRERVGESLRSLQREEPLAQVTTGSMEALRLYSQALRALDAEADEDRAIALLEDAVRQDTAFAMAWRKLGVILGNRFEERPRQVEALTRAFEHRDRLTEPERRHAAATYYYNVAGQPARAADELESLLERHPDDDYALNNLGVMRGFLRQHAAAESLYVVAFEADTLSSLSYTNALQEQFAQGKVEEARATLALYERRFPANVDGAQYRGALAAATGQYDAAEEHFRTFLDRASESPYQRREAMRSLAAMAALRGRLEEAERGVRRVMQADRDRGVPSSALLAAADLADVDLWVRRDTASALRRLRDAVAELDAIEPQARPYLRLAIGLAAAGAPSDARALVDAFEGTMPVGIRSWRDHVELDWALGEIALAEGRPDAAVEAFRRADVGFCTICALEPLGRAHEAAGHPDSALVAYEGYLETPWLWRHLAFDRAVRGRVLERLAELHEERGDLQAAARYYAELTELWAEADPELRPRVEAARERLEGILARTG